MRDRGGAWVKVGSMAHQVAHLEELDCAGHEGAPEDDLTQP